jgi:hypothetical protein
MDRLINSFINCFHRWFAVVKNVTRLFRCVAYPRGLDYPQSYNLTPAAMTQSHQNDPLPALIETWIQELATTRFALERLLTAVAHVLEDGEEAGFERRMSGYDYSYDKVVGRFQAETESYLQESPEKILLAMIHATGSLRTEQLILKSAVVELLSKNADVPPEDVQRSIDQEKLQNPYPPSDHEYIPHILRSLFRKKGSQSDSDPSNS